MTHRSILASLLAVALVVVLTAGGCATGGSTSATVGDGGDDGSSGDGALSGDSGCSTGQMLCGATCTSTGTDPKNCGKCGFVCASSQVCSQGTCGFSCTGGDTLCGAAPIGPDAGTSAKDAAAAVDASMSDSSVEPEGGGEEASTPEAGGPVDATVGDGGAVQPYCANLNNDPSNCGQCGNVCPANHACNMGHCGLNCPIGMTACIAGNNCIAAGECCDSNDCTVTGETCPMPGGKCGCPSGEKACTANSSCISTNDCCTNADCPVAGSTCPTAGQACQCMMTGYKACTASMTCIPDATCCTSADCSAITGSVCSMPGGTCGCSAKDMNGQTCAAATSLGTLALGQTAPATGLIPTGTGGDWFTVTFSNESSTSFHGKILFTANPGMQFVFDIVQTSCTGTDLPCGEGGKCTSKTEWEESYAGVNPPGDPTNASFTPIPAIGAVFIHVYRSSTSETPTCDQYSLQVGE